MKRKPTDDDAFLVERHRRRMAGLCTGLHPVVGMTCTLPQNHEQNHRFVRVAHERKSKKAGG